MLRPPTCLPCPPCLGHAGPLKLLSPRSANGEMGQKPTSFYSTNELEAYFLK